MFDYPVNIQSECRGEQAVLPLKTLKSTIVPSYRLRFYNYWVGMVYYIYIYYYIYYNIYNNIYKSIGGVLDAKSIFDLVRWYDGTKSNLRIFSIEVRIWLKDYENLRD